VTLGGRAGLPVSHTCLGFRLIFQHINEEESLKVTKDGRKKLFFDQFGCELDYCYPVHIFSAANNDYNVFSFPHDAPAVPKSASQQSVRLFFYR
jgi:hypothetical protein